MLYCKRGTGELGGELGGARRRKRTAELLKRPGAARPAGPALVLCKPRGGLCRVWCGRYIGCGEAVGGQRPGTARRGVSWAERGRAACSERPCAQGAVCMHQCAYDQIQGKLGNFTVWMVRRQRRRLPVLPGRSKVSHLL